MKKIRNVLGVFFILVGGIYFVSQHHFTPKYSGQIQWPALKDKVDVYYDSYGIPHIQAQNRADLYRAYGFVVMQDRYFQIQLQKMIAGGRMSEWFGSATIETDKVLRNLGPHYYMAKWYQKNKFRLQPELMKDLEAWLEGVNQCIAICPRPIELVLLNAQPEIVTIDDVLAFSAVMSFTFTKNYFSDALLSKVSRTVQGEALDEIVGTATGATHRFATHLQMKSLREMDPLNLIPQMDGSQSWVLSPHKSASGSATLANDPHIGFSNPGVWYEAHLQSPGFELYGHFSPLIPFALIGHNQDKAWALTMSYTDDLDLLSEPHMNRLQERREIIHVKNAADVELKLLDSEFGPVINELLKNNQNAILYWHYYRDDNLALESFYELAHAKTLDDYYAAIKKGRSPGVNISWADKSGNIAWKILGYFPLRTLPFWQIRPVHSQNDQAVDDSKIPQIKNPVSEYILSANQRPPVDFDDKHIVGFWDRGERYQALKNDLEQHFKIDIPYQKKMFTNNTFSEAADRLKKMLKSVKTDDEIRLVLQNWDGQARMENQAQGFYLIWTDEIVKHVLKDQFSTVEMEQFCSSPNYWKFAATIIDRPQSRWWNDQYQKILQDSFDKTLHFFKTTYGNTNHWSWSKIHTVEFEHPLGRVRWLRPFFNLGPYPIDGGGMVPNAFRHKMCSGHFNVTGGASTRRLIDFKDPKESWGILPTGNSGVPFSRHFDDQVNLYLAGEFRPQLMNWDKIKELPQHLELNP